MTDKTTLDLDPIDTVDAENDLIPIWDASAETTKNVAPDYYKSAVLTKDNTDPFTPDADYEPATKKYVDDNSGGGGYVNVTDYGALGNGTTNESSSILSAANSLGAAGGCIYFPEGKYLIDSNLIIPKHITLKGAFSFVGGTVASDYSSLAALIISSDVTLTLGAGSGLSGFLIYRKGISFPVTGETSFAGTAITFNGDDCFVFNTMILGFNKLIYSTGHQRPNIKSVQGDGVNGIEIINCTDVGRITDVQLWPFAIYDSDGDYKRSGTAFKFSNTGDWNKITDCFCWGYRYGYVVDSCNSVTLLGCGADGPKEDSLSIGFWVTGGSTDTRLIGCQSAGQYTAYLIDTSDDINTRLIGCDAWGNNDHGILISGGDVSITGGLLRGDCNGVSINDASSEVLVDQLKNICTVSWNIIVSPTQFYKGLINTGAGWAVESGGSSEVSDTAYSSSTWDGVTTIAPSKNAVRDKIESMGSASVSDTAYSKSTWDGVTGVAPSKNAVRDKIEAMLSQQSWQTVTYKNSWVTYDSDHNAAGYYKDNFGVVHLQGWVKNGDFNGPIFTLPVGYRPSKSMFFVVICDGYTLGGVKIEADGDVVAGDGSNSGLSLEGITFRV
ncbi:MAG: hypothetical protein M0P69_11140 [Bacteroidales bacterium]|nr:hypothetical protein [Bacteroidales bacterium]